MKIVELKLTRIGNSRGIRIPAELIEEYNLSSGIVLDLRAQEIGLRGKTSKKKLSWQETARQIASSDEDWSSWEQMSDGLAGE